MTSRRPNQPAVNHDERDEARLSLDIARLDELAAYLRAEGHIGVDAHPAMRVLQGGISCRTVRVELGPSEIWVVKQALRQLAVEVEWYSEPQRIHQEALAMIWLRPIMPPGSITELLFEDERCHLVAMTAVPEPHERLKERLMRGTVAPKEFEELGRMLACIHSGALLLDGEPDRVFADRRHFESLRLEPFYTYSSKVQGAAAFLRELVHETRANALSLVHGDFSPKNVLVTPERLVLLDHEVIHWGDTAFDLGFFMAHILSKAHHLPDRRGDLLDAALLFWATYLAHSESVFHDPAYQERSVRQSIGCFLARAVGRSPLEYLDEVDRRRQVITAVGLIDDAPSTFSGLVTQFQRHMDAA